MLEYKGYKALYERDPDQQLWVGWVVNAQPDTLVFQGETREELQAQLAAMIEEYLASAIQTGHPAVQPQELYDWDETMGWGDDVHHNWNDIKPVITAVREAFTTRLARSAWMEAPNRFLQGDTPRARLARKDYQSVLDALEALASGVMV